jgi:hypothetical protein
MGGIARLTVDSGVRQIQFFPILVYLHDILLLSACKRQLKKIKIKNRIHVRGHHRGSSAAQLISAELSTGGKSRDIWALLRNALVYIC